MLTERGAKHLELERKCRIDGLDTVHDDREAGFDRGFVDRIIGAVAVEGAHARGGEVDAHELAVIRMPPDVGSSADGVLRRDHERALESRLFQEPAFVQPGVVGPRQARGEGRVPHHREEKQMVGEQHGGIDVQLRQLHNHLASRAHELTAVATPGEGHPVLGTRRHPRKVQVALRHLRDLPEPDVPGRVRVFGELAGALVNVNVGVDDEQRFKSVAARRTVCARGCVAHGPRSPSGSPFGAVSYATMPPAAVDAIGSFHVHPGHGFEGFEIIDRGTRGEIVVARCACGAVLDVADASFAQCSECEGSGARRATSVTASAACGACMRCGGTGRVVDHAALTWRLPTEMEERDAKLG
jgi:hypothetical protein